MRPLHKEKQIGVGNVFFVNTSFINQLQHKRKKKKHLRPFYPNVIISVYSFFHILFSCPKQRALPALRSLVQLIHW